MSSSFLRVGSLVAVIALIPMSAGCAGCEAAGPALPAAGPNAIDITVKTDPPGGTVIVDGASLGPSPQAVKLNPGPHRVRASMSGYYPAQEMRIQVGAEGPREVTVPLVASH